MIPTPASPLLSVWNRLVFGFKYLILGLLNPYISVHIFPKVQLQLSAWIVFFFKLDNFY